MRASLFRFFVFFVLIVAIDQAIKWVFLHGFSYRGGWFDLILVYNKGVAFSWFAFLGAYLKYIQVGLICLIFGYLLGEKAMLSRFSAELGMVLGAGASNIADRFMHPGVVDYFYWHKWFDFAVFNFADVMIDLGVAIIILRLILKK